MKNKFSRKSLLLVSMTVILATVINLFAGVVAFADVAATTDVIEIGSADELKKIGNDDAYPLSGTYKLTKDIDLSDADGNKTAWTPIGDDSNGFTGTFDGNGHTISGFTVSGTTTAYAGFFCSLDSGVVKNLRIADADIYTSASSYRVGTIAGNVVGTDKKVNLIIGCVVENSVTVQNYEDANHAGQPAVGGMVGYLSTAGISYCENNATVTVSEAYNSNGAAIETFVGGVVGISGGAYLQNCVNNGSVTLGSDSYTAKKSGGWAAVGGIAGNVRNWSAWVECSSNVNHGNVTFVNGDCAGGIAGSVTGSADWKTGMKSNYNLGTIVADSNAGQIMGYEVKKVNADTAGMNYACKDNGNATGYSINFGETSTDKTMTAAELKETEGYKAIISAIAENTYACSTTAVGYQTTKANSEGNFDLRLVATLGGNYEDITNVGFKVTATYGTDGVQETEKTMTTVYNNISAEADTGATVSYSAAELGGDYIFVLACKNLPTTEGDITFTITTFYTDANGVARENAAQTFTVDVENIPTADMPAKAA